MKFHLLCHNQVNNAFTTATHILRPSAYVIITLFFGFSLSDALYYALTTLAQVPKKQILNNIRNVLFIGTF